ncbi:hypothetical protein VSH64_39470 [Amycolatopsis rhabdoformis]|uniref:Uncharacterized protein n=1 Tax=Amycolatopsis rhabdoformis TaxID=1448059 RepID=A0ABZ1I3L8_9PSEU|nr:hypothetical protein [Amycolatopsis rhabdoformis]WSE28850.1 hypothetical protein VSH64_39470 [Amycolatopsis rhabdoformis]
MRIRFAVSVGALLLVGGALTGGAVAFAQPAPPTATRPAAPPQASTAAPTLPTKRPTEVAPPTAVPTRMPAQAPGVKAPGSVRVPTAIPAGPTGDLNLPDIWG